MHCDGTVSFLTDYAYWCFAEWEEQIVAAGGGAYRHWREAMTRGFEHTGSRLWFSTPQNVALTLGRFGRMNHAWSQCRQCEPVNWVVSRNLFSNFNPIFNFIPVEQHLWGVSPPPLLRSHHCQQVFSLQTFLESLHISDKTCHQTATYTRCFLIFLLFLSKKHIPKKQQFRQHKPNISWFYQKNISKKQQNLAANTAANHHLFERKDVSRLVAVVFPMAPKMGFVEVVHKPDKNLALVFQGVRLMLLSIWDV